MFVCVSMCKCVRVYACSLYPHHSSHLEHTHGLHTEPHTINYPKSISLWCLKLVVFNMIKNCLIITAELDYLCPKPHAATLHGILTPHGQHTTVTLFRTIVFNLGTHTHTHISVIPNTLFCDMLTLPTGSVLNHILLHYKVCHSAGTENT